MALVIPNIESNPTFDGQSALDFTDWSALFSAAQGPIGTGVISGGTVSPGTGMQVAIAAGAGYVLGQRYSWTAANITVTANSGNADRRDAVVYTVGTGLQVLPGLYCSLTGTVWTRGNANAYLPPVKPTLTSSQLLLGEVYAQYNINAIVSGNIVDKTALIPAKWRSTLIARYILT